MTDKKQEIETPYATRRREGDGLSGRLDPWLEQQLQALHSDILNETLPDDIGRLATQLEQRLSSAMKNGAGNKDHEGEK